VSIVIVARRQVRPLFLVAILKCQLYSSDSSSVATTITVRPTYPQKTVYAATDVYTDLLDLAAAHLVDGGRLVYWLPCVYQECVIFSENCRLLKCGLFCRYTPASVPQHSQLTLVSLIGGPNKLDPKY
jgi:hypothetical protein